MKFKLIAKFDEPVNCYTGEKISTGDIIELDGHLAEKASKNPNYQEVKKVVKKAAKKVKNDNQSGSGSTSG